MGPSAEKSRFRRKKKREAKNKTPKQRWGTPRIRKKGKPGKGGEAGAKQEHWFLVLFHFVPSLGRFLHARENRSKLADFLADRSKCRYSRISRQICPNTGF
jgi:hypothetical protein